MKKLKLRLLLPSIAVMAFLLAGCCNPEITGSVPNTLHTQETNNWCWAATTEMLAAHFGITVTQCSLANTSFGRSDCCTPQNQGTTCPKNNNCNMPGWPMLDFVGLKFTESKTALAWDDLRKQIYCSKKPMGYAYGTPGVVGHVLVIKGYLTLAGTNYLVLNDPWAPCAGQERIITYAEYADPAGTSTHWSTFYNLDKK